MLAVHRHGLTSITPGRVLAMTTSTLIVKVTLQCECQDITLPEETITNFNKKLSIAEEKVTVKM